MESTAQYWKPVWGALERYGKPTCRQREGVGPMSGTLHLAQALSNRGRRGRKNDFRDAERLGKRRVAQELTLSFVPDAEPRLGRTVTRRKYQLTRNRVRLQNQWESLREEAHIKLSSLVSDRLGTSARRMLKGLADGETDPVALGALADQRLRATQAQLCEALGACRELSPVYRRLLKMALAELQFRSANWTGRSPVCSASIRMRCSGWPRCLVWVWIRGSRLSPQWGLQQRHFPQANSSRRGLEHVPETKRVRGNPRATAPRRATATCGAFSINAPMPRSGRKAASLKSSIAVLCRASDTIKLSGRLPIGFVA